jgi:hypothetical protein
MGGSAVFGWMCGWVFLAGMAAGAFRAVGAVVMVAAVVGMMGAGVA